MKDDERALVMVALVLVVLWLRRGPEGLRESELTKLGIKDGVDRDETSA